MVGLIDNNGREVVLESSMMLQMHDREMDQQITTAKKFPRTVARVISEIKSYATESEDTAQECVYALPRAGKTIIGPTARFAEIVATSWGNARYAARIIDENDNFVVAQAVFHDLEKNNFISVEVPRRIIDSNGKRYNVDMIGVTSSAAMSVAMRNAILKGIPKAAWGGAYEQCLALIRGTFETIEARRNAAIKHFSKVGVTEDMVLALLQKQEVRDIEPEDILVLRGTLQAIRDGDTTVQRVFGSIDRGPQQPDRSKANIAGQLEKGKAANAAKKPSGQETGKQTEPSKGKAADGGSSSGGGAAQAGEGSGDFPGDTPADAGVDNAGTGEGREGAPDAGGSDGDLQSQSGKGTPGDGPGIEEAALIEIPAGMIPDREGEESWTDAEVEKLEKLARMLLGAKTTAEVGKMADAQLASFESGGPELEAAYQSMVSDRRRAVRGAGRNRL